MHVIPGIELNSAGEGLLAFHLDPIRLLSEVV